jgi:hypothetical protein
LATFERVNGVQVHRVWTSRFGRKNLVGRTSDYLSFYISASFKLYALTGPGTVIVAKTGPAVDFGACRLDCALAREVAAKDLRNAFFLAASTAGAATLFADSGGCASGIAETGT